MESIILFMMAPAVWCIQLVLCYVLKRAILKWIPAMGMVLAEVFCFVMYSASGFTNWGYLLLMLFIGLSLGADLMAWLLYAVLRFMNRGRSETGPRLR